MDLTDVIVDNAIDGVAFDPMVDLPFDTQIRIWGFSLHGDKAEPTAWMCEAGWPPPPMERWTDRRPIPGSTTIVRNEDGTTETVPLWWNLPGCVEWYLRTSA